MENPFVEKRKTEQAKKCIISYMYGNWKVWGNINLC